MKQRTGFMKRSLALLLVAIMVVSNLSGLTLPVRAAENNGTTVSKGEIVAGNYDLTAAEKALLSSGLLIGGSITFTAPTDSELIEINTEAKTIKATTYRDAQGNIWEPTAAAIYVGEAKKEDVQLTNGAGSYTYGQNAFSVKVTYTLMVEVEENLQLTLLGAPTMLQGGLNTLKGAYDGTDANLGTVVSAMEVLSQLADGYRVDMGWAQVTIQFEEAAIAAVEALEAELAANGGMLKLQKMNAAYAAASSKVQFLVENGAEYRDIVAQTYELMAAICGDAALNDQILDSYLSSTDPENYTLWRAMKGIINNTTTALETAVNGQWGATETQLLADGLTAAQYLTLDALVADLTTTNTISTVKEKLLVAEAEVALNMSMFDVTVTVVLETTQNNTVRQYASVTTKLTLAEGATRAEILAAVAESAFVDGALASWAGVYVAEHFSCTTSTLPETLTADTTYVVTYSPKYYTVNFSYAEAQSLPYGYELVLPRHENPAEAYDYVINGVTYAQGAIYTVVEDANITRTAGKAYSSYDLYSIIAENYGDPALQAIMTSGALNGNVTINVRKPDPADAESLVELRNGYLTAREAYASDYQGLVWVPYSYGRNGDENLFNGNYTVAWSEGSVKVQYTLVLSNYSAADVKAILDSMVALKAEANDQVNTLNRLGAYHSTMGMLDKTKLGGMNGVIDVTDFTPGDGNENDAKNLELRAYFKSMVGGIISNNLDADGKLKIYNMLTKYLDPNTGGLRYYYENYAAVSAEIDSLSGYLNGMLADAEKKAALEVMVTAAGYPEYAEKIENLATVMEEVREALSAPNALINLSSSNLYKLIEALENTGDATYTTPASPYLMSETLTALDETTAIVQVIVNVNGHAQTFTSPEFAPGTVLSQDVVDALIANVEAFAAQQLGNKISFYQVTGLEELRAMVGTELQSGRVNMFVNYEAIQYTIIIDGMDTVVVDINNLQLILPAHTTEGYVYVYTVFGREITVGQTPVTITLTAAELASIQNNVYTITWYDYNKAEADSQGKLDTLVNELKEALGNKNVTLKGNKLNVSMSADQLMDFVMTLVLDGGYSYYGLNGENFIYMNEENTLQLSMQTLINAIFSDPTFSSQKLIAMGKNNGGELLNATMQLGDSATLIDYNLELVISFNSVPGTMKTALSALESLSSYLTFKSSGAKDGQPKLEVMLNLPDQVYGAYLTALVATGYAEKMDMNAVNQQIAFQFLLDYLDAIINSGADMTTLENTLAMLGKEADLEKYNAYYQMLLDTLNYSADVNGLNLDLTMEGKPTIDNLLSILGMGNSFGSYLGMLAEYKTGAYINIPVHVTLANADRDYCALILDVNASGVTNKFEVIRTGDWTALRNKTSKIAGYAYIILLDDVQGDLIVSGTTILDLNGHDVTGTIKGTGNLFIIDSTMDTYNAGTVNDVSGKVTIIAGNYLSDVKSYLKDGYYMDGTAVRNALYYIESNNGNINFVVNTDVYKSDKINGYLPNLAALAMDMGFDLVLNYATTAGLAVDGDTLYSVTFRDLLGLLESRSGEDAINMVLDTISETGLSAFANNVLADLINFKAIYAAMKNGTNVAQYQLTLSPWMVAVERAAGDYMTLSILANDKLAKSYNVGLRLEGTSYNYVMNMVGELAQIVEQNKTYITVDVAETVYNDRTFYFSVAGSAVASIDMSNNTNYAKFLAIILAYGNREKAADVVNAITNERLIDLRTVIDNTTVAELFKALKAMDRNTDLKAMAKAIGLTGVDLTEVAALENVYHLTLVGMGKVLEELNITGRNAKLIGLYNETTGYYELSKENMFRDGELSARGIGADYELSLDKLAFSLKLFRELKEELHEHKWGEWITESNGSCTTATVRYRVCSCGEVEYEVIPAPGHNHLPHVTNPTCTEKGYTTYICSVCGDSYVASFVPALGHSYETVVTNPTCTEKGYTTYICSVCGDSYVADHVDALGHSYEAVVTNPTCTEAGYTTYTCSVCGDTYQADFVDALGHNYEGITTDPTCTERGYTTYTCSVCGESHVADYVDALGHKYDAVVTAPTCTEAGYTTYTCSVCGDTYVADHVDALGHTWGEWVVTKEAECVGTEVDGVKERTCECCGEVESEVIPHGDHVYVDGNCQWCGVEEGGNPSTGRMIAIGGIICLLAVNAYVCFLLVTKRKELLA